MEHESLGKKMAALEAELQAYKHYVDRLKAVATELEKDAQLWYVKYQEMAECWNAAEGRAEIAEKKLETLKAVSWLGTIWAKGCEKWNKLIKS